jgi:Flp pilus assembly protein TadD
MRASLICLFLWVACAPVLAEDTPSNMGADSALLTSPRAAIAARDWERAILELQASLRLEPFNADVHNLLGYSYRKRAQPDLTRAFFHYNEALRLNPDHRAAREYLGEAYLQAGQPDKAREQLEALERICGRECEEYRDLAAAIAGTVPVRKAW